MQCWYCDIREAIQLEQEGQSRLEKAEQGRNISSQPSSSGELRDIEEAQLQDPEIGVIFQLMESRPANPRGMKYNLIVQP